MYAVSCDMYNTMLWWSLLLVPSHFWYSSVYPSGHVTKHTSVCKLTMWHVTCTVGIDPVHSMFPCLHSCKTESLMPTSINVNHIVLSKLCMLMYMFSNTEQAGHTYRQTWHVVNYMTWWVHTGIWTKHYIAATKAEPHSYYNVVIKQ